MINTLFCSFKNLKTIYRWSVLFPLKIELALFLKSIYWHLLYILWCLLDCVQRYQVFSIVIFIREHYFSLAVSSQACYKCPVHMAYQLIAHLVFYLDIAYWIVEFVYIDMKMFANLNAIIKQKLSICVALEFILFSVTIFVYIHEFRFS